VEQSEYYTEFYRNRSLAGDFVMMDNSVIELKEPVELKRVLAAAKKVRAQEIILPDRLQDRIGTIQLLRESFNTLNLLQQSRQFSPDAYNPKIQVVPQGETIEDWFACLEDMMTFKHDWQTIGVPRCTNDLKDATRADVLQRIDEVFKGDPPFEVHLLGLSNNVTELRLYRDKYPWIRGVDSKLPIRCGINMIGFHPDKGLLLTSTKCMRPMDMFEEEDLHPALTYYNIDIMKEMAGDLPLAEVIQWPLQT